MIAIITTVANDVTKESDQLIQTFGPAILKSA